MQALVDWAQDTYDYEINRHGGDYPYLQQFKTAEMQIKQVLTWFVTEWKNPRTGMTPLEEFVDKFIKDPKLAAKINQINLLFYGIFRITQRISDHTVEAVDTDDQNEYRIRFLNKLPRSCEGMLFSGYIHPWFDDGAYRTLGIVTFHLLPGT